MADSLQAMVMPDFLFHAGPLGKASYSSRAFCFEKRMT
jgi:hypothetical protein